MITRKILFALAVIVFAGSFVNADTITYTYTGAPMVSAPNALSGGNCATCSIMGSITLDSPLLPTAVLIGASELVTPSSYSFTATGLGKLTDHNSSLLMYVSVQPSGDISSFYFTITGSKGFIYSDFYGSAFEFTDYYYGPNGKKAVSAEGNYLGNPWTMLTSTATLSTNFATASDLVPAAEPPIVVLLLCTLMAGVLIQVAFPLPKRS